VRKKTGGLEWSTRKGKRKHRGGKIKMEDLLHMESLMELRGREGGGEEEGKE